MKAVEQEKKTDLCHIVLYLFRIYLYFTGSKDDELDSDDLDDEEDEDEEDENDEEPSGHTETNETETLDSLKRYMDQMDQELMSTNIGQSFNQIVR